MARSIPPMMAGDLKIGLFEHGVTQHRGKVVYSVQQFLRRWCDARQQTRLLACTVARTGAMRVGPHAHTRPVRCLPAADLYGAA